MGRSVELIMNLHMCRLICSGICKKVIDPNEPLDGVPDCKKKRGETSKSRMIKYANCHSSPPSVQAVMLEINSK